MSIFAGTRLYVIRPQPNMLMPKRNIFFLLLVYFLLFASFVRGQDDKPIRDGKKPVIVIPGLIGSNLVNRTTNKLVWFKSSRSKDDDIRLPVSPNLAKNTDDLESRDILRSIRFFKILPEIEVYERLIHELEKRGYREAKWSEPGPDDGHDTFFVFPYDWRRDNVESSRLLVRRIETLKKALGKPDIKFNIIAHSMGGLIARYAAMYGDSDMPSGKIAPSWAGARHFDKIFLLGTPNEGSIDTINALLNGVAFGGGINLPFIRNINRFDVFTIPSVYQLLPHEGTLLVYDEDLKPVKLDIFNDATWDEYDWSIWRDKKFHKTFTSAEQENARKYFRTALLRAKRFQEALDAESKLPVKVAFYLVGSDCKDTQNALLLRRDENKDLWIAQFKAKSFKRSSGEVVETDVLAPLLFAKGDGVVTKRSLTRASSTRKGSRDSLPITGEIFQCETHNKLVTNSVIPDKIFALIDEVESARR